MYKSFITRVGAGPLPGEITKEEAQKRGWFEVAAGTGRDRRSAPFDFDLAKKTAKINGATQAAMTKLDCYFPMPVKVQKNIVTCPKKLKTS